MQLVKKVIFFNFKQTERLPDDTSVSTEEKRFLQKKAIFNDEGSEFWGQF